MEFAGARDRACRRPRDDRHPPVQAQLGGDIAAFVAALDAIVSAAGIHAVQRGQLLIPSPKFVNAGISLQRRWVVDLMRALRELAGGGFIAMPSAETFEADETAEDVGRYYRSATLSAHDGSPCSRRCRTSPAPSSPAASSSTRCSRPQHSTSPIGRELPGVRLGDGSCPRPGFRDD